ncbi:hypothetical protein GUITHDRAFT_142411 [Guillardia theta CCMP2712]|uniref:Uncharacterized protein n=1 Tax=Guillardia theta (strain CCMP2712) TaxID=905079 RepID=L1IXM0_GUITC|nr:hypothetical protein GUITHDRAFT_142411 [Guillardia theta CCMP2712]EKX41023.1 hypothetical protein GUITHDRAFT_142411 [Guillardia theta CCMP2712]|eukprot:XP_005828003.1 hypothetical protein GUITHDRAFT_142411 [Guillardia theta CCMP2712]
MKHMEEELVKTRTLLGEEERARGEANELIEGYKSAMKEKEEELEELKSLCSSLRSESDQKEKLMSKFSELKKTLEAVIEEKEILESRLAEMEEERGGNAEASQQLAAAEMKRIEAEGKYAESLSQIKQLEEKLEQKQKEVESMTSEQGKVEERDSAMREQARQLQEAIEERDRLRSQIADSAYSGELLEKARQDLEDYKRQHKSDRTRFTQEISLLQEQISNSNQSVETLTEQEERDRAIADYNRIEEILQEKSLALEEENRSNLEKLQQSNEELVQAKVELDNIQKEWKAQQFDSVDKQSWQVKKLQVAAEEDEAMVATLLKLSSQLLLALNDAA